uniref:Secreted protein n=1 Tax=Trichuris muris TaxID=70415 RepID=A0A5S6QJC7_TRIMR
MMCAARVILLRHRSAASASTVDKRNWAHNENATGFGDRRINGGGPNRGQPNCSRGATRTAAFPMSARRKRLSSRPNNGQRSDDAEKIARWPGETVWRLATKRNERSNYGDCDS